MFILVNPQVLPTQHQPRKKGQKTYLICTLLSGHYVPVVFPKLVRFRQAQVYALPRYIFFWATPHTRTCHNICEAIRLQEVLPRVLVLGCLWIY